MTAHPLILPSLFLLGWFLFWSFSYAAPYFYARATEKEPEAPITNKRARRQFYAIFALATLAHGAGFWNMTALSYTAVPPEITLVVFYLGILLAMFASWNIRFLSFRDMVFSITPHKVNSGPYRFIRHPMYAGLTLAFSGFLLAYPTIAGTVSLAGIIWIFLMRASAEENTQTI